MDDRLAGEYVERVAELTSFAGVLDILISYGCLCVNFLTRTCCSIR